jgi:hypothetical protein
MKTDSQAQWMFFTILYYNVIETLVTEQCNFQAATSDKILLHKFEVKYVINLCCHCCTSCKMVQA